MSAEWLLGLAAVGFVVSVAGFVVMIPGLRTHPQTTSYAMAGMVCLGMVSLCVGAYALGQGSGSVAALIFLALINLVIQPICLLLFVGSTYKVTMALWGRATYAFRTIPPERFRAEEYRALRTHCITGGTIGMTFSAGMAYVCLRPLL